MKKRYIALGLVALEILCFPVAAQIFSKVSSSPVSDYAVSTLLPDNEAGVANLVVSSNGPFVLSVSNLTGKVDVKVIESGAINVTRFGDNAQMPGPDQQCSASVNAQPSIIYSADRKTAKTAGEILSQSVVMKISYPEGGEPEFKVLPRKEAAHLPQAAACESV